VVAIAEEHAGGRIVALLEGGYQPRALARGVVGVLRAFDGEAPGDASATAARADGAGLAPAEETTARR
jgi:acetoin utilization deacetylase AcuC-like enzyme